jgi:hypothetical protein
MSKKRKQKLTIWDLGRIERTPVAQPTGDAVPAGTLSQYRRRLASEEEEARIAAEHKQIVQAEQATIAERNSPLTRAVAFFWSQPLQDIRTNLSDDVYDNGAKLVPVDAFGEYETGPRNAVEEDAAFADFNTALTSQGCTLYRGGFLRLQGYLESLAAARGVSLSSVANYKTALDRLVSLDCFEGPHELEGYPPATKKVKQPEEPRRATMDDLLNVDESTRAGRREAQRISEELYFIERQPMVRAWFASLAKNFGIEVTHADAERCKSWFERNNKSFLNPHHFNECRLWNARAGYWPDALTSVERVNDEIEKADLTRMGFDERRILSNKKRAAQEEDRAKFGHSQ